MKTVLERIIDEFHERPIPVPSFREAEAKEVDRRACVVVGMRRSGKTWFCYQRMTRLAAQGITKDRILYVNFDDERLLPFAAADFETLMDEFLARTPSDPGKVRYLFLDEVQRIQGWDLFIRRVLDGEPSVRLWITGSSAKLMSAEIATALRGRALTTEIFPFSFREFLRFHGEGSVDDGRYGPQKRATLRRMLERYLTTGGFPEVQSVDAETSRIMLQGYVDAVILRDIVERHGVRNVLALRSMIRTVLSSPGGRFSVHKFHNTLKSQGITCDKNDLYRYLEYLTDAFFTYPVEIHSRSVKARQVNPRKVYAIDTGLVRAMSSGMTDDRSALLENMVFMHLRRKGIHPDYHVTVKGNEVDFAIAAGDRVDLIQACWSIRDPAARARELRGLAEAQDELRTGRRLIVTWNEEQSLPGGIEVVPAWKWLLA